MNRSTAIVAASEAGAAGVAALLAAAASGVHDPLTLAGVFVGGAALKAAPTALVPFVRDFMVGLVDSASTPVEPPQEPPKAA